jgi:hypothetical protein
MALLSTYAILTQLVGFVGYGLLLGATLARGRLRLLAIDASGGTVLVGHWLMLGALAGVTMNALYTAIDLAGLDPTSRRGRMLLVAAVPAAALLTWAFWQGPADLLATAGVLFAVASRASRSQVRLRGLAMVGCIPWGLFGVVNMSIPQIIFSAVYFVAMGWSIVRIRRGWAPQASAVEGAILPADGSR